MTTKTHSRRTMLRVLGAFGGTMAVLPVVGCSGGGESAGCNDMAGVDVRTRTALNYLTESTDPARRCSGCTLYVAPTGGNACGTCQAFPGPVEANGTCNSFVARP